MNNNAIRKEVARIIDRLPKRFRDRLENLEIVVDDFPSPEALLEVGLNPDTDVLYGLYQGVPLPERSSLDPPLLPDKITLFAEVLRRDYPDPQELKDEIRITVLHEIAHYFGLDEEAIENLGY